MEAFFKNFIVVFFVTGILTRLTNYILQKKFLIQGYFYLSFGIAFIFFVPLMVWYVGFDVAVSEYVLTLIIWLLIDIMHSQAKKEKK